MEKRELSSLVKLKESADSVVVSIRIRSKLASKLKAKGIDINKTVKAVLERLSE